MIKKYITNIVDKLEEYRYALSIAGLGLAVGAVFVSVTGYVANKAYDSGFKDGCEVTVVSNRIAAINANLGQFIITNKLTGETSFQYKTNTILTRSTLF